MKAIRRHGRSASGSQRGSTVLGGSPADRGLAGPQQPNGRRRYRRSATPLDQHLHNDIWGGVAQQLVAYRLETGHTTVDLYAPTFNQAVALNAKSLIVLMVLPFALLPALVFCRSRRPFVAHVVFSLHFYAFLLLLLCVSLTVLGGSLLLGGPGLESETFDHALSIAELLLCAIYLYIAVGTVYGARGAARVLKVLPLALAVGAIFLGYRFALLPITLAST